MKRPVFSAEHRQAGVVLVISLIMLLALSLIGISALRSTTLEERMAGNMKAKQRSFQAAELALRQAEADIRNGAASALADDGLNCADGAIDGLGDDAYSSLATNNPNPDERLVEVHLRYCAPRTREYRDAAGNRPCSDAGGQACIFVNYHRVIGVGRIPGNAGTALKSTYAVMF
jgi:hypothetical protein